MNKRTFLKTSSALVAGSLFSPMLSCREDQKPPTNWAGNLTYSTGNVRYPKTLEEIQDIVRKSAKIRALGSRHSFNTIADSTVQQVSLKELNKVVSLDRQANTVTIEGGMTYGQLCEYLHKEGYALHNLASLPHISVAGACATATHGSGIKNGNLATGVAGLELVDAAGEMHTLIKGQPGGAFDGAVVGLGGLGVVSKVTLAVQPTFMMQQAVYRNLPTKTLATDFEKIMSSGDSVSLFTDWQNDRVSQVWIKKRVEGTSTDPVKLDPEFYGATLATKDMHPLEDLSAENCTKQMGVPGPWYERMPHFRMGFTPSSGKELQSEYFLPIEHAYDAIMALVGIKDQITPHLFVSEIRTIAADTLWMSPHYNQTCVAMHFTWKQEWDAVQKVLPVIEEKLSPFTVRPHWGKLFTMAPAQLQSRVQKLPEFKQLLQQYDPQGKFKNAFLESAIG